MTKLLASHSLSVRREALRKAKEAAKKAHPSKMAFTMTAKLLPAIFSWEELASSRGQGLKSKEGDTRPVLDVSKMTILKGIDKGSIILVNFNTLNYIVFNNDLTELH